MKKAAEKNRRQRLKPRIYDFSYFWCRSHLSTLRRFNRLLYQLCDNPTILDIGCGDKPLQTLFPRAEYLGVDLNPESAADIVLDCNHDRLPINNDTVDAVIFSNTLEHIYNTQHIIQEAKRVLRPQGILFFSVPMTYPLHAHPHDYIRFTKYYFDRTFLNWETIELNITNSLFSTPLLLCGQILATFLPAFVIFIPILFINLTSLLLDFTTKRLFSFINSDILNNTWESCPMELSGIYRKISN